MLRPLRSAGEGGSERESQSQHLPPASSSAGRPRGSGCRAPCPAGPAFAARLSFPELVSGQVFQNHVDVEKSQGEFQASLGAVRVWNCKEGPEAPLQDEGPINKS